MRRRDGGGVWIYNTQSYGGWVSGMGGAAAVGRAGWGSPHGGH